MIATVHKIRNDPDHRYESEQRKHILSRDWARVHVEADRRQPFGKAW